VPLGGSYKRATRTVEQGFLFGVGTFVPHCTHPLTGGEIKDNDQGGGCSFLSLALAKPLTIQATINAAKKTAKHGARSNRMALALNPRKIVPESKVFLIQTLGDLSADSARTIKNDYPNDPEK
jgi:hypothetical protein